MFLQLYAVYLTKWTIRIGAERKGTHLNKKHCDIYVLDNSQDDLDLSH
jgi:hypothetical protein